MKDRQQRRANALYGKRDPDTWEDYEQGYRLPF
jgi:hypothetical protein